MKKENPDFKLIVKDLIEQGVILKSIKDIARDLETGQYTYRTVYAYINQDNPGSIETAARIARSVGLTLNDIYVPKDGSGWPSGKEEPVADPVRIDRALKILDLLERPFNGDELTKKANALLREANTVSNEQGAESAIPYYELAEKLQILTEYAARKKKAAGGDERDETK